MLIQTFEWKSSTWGFPIKAYLYKSCEDRYFVNLYLNDLLISSTWYEEREEAFTALGTLKRCI